MSIYVGKTPIYSTRDKILYIESSRSNLVNLDTVNKDPKIKTGDFILGQNTSGITKNFVIEQDNINIISISQSNIYINTPSLFDKNAVIDGNLNVTGDITSLGSLTTNSNLTIGDTLNASIINTSNLSIFNNQLGKIFTAGSNTETGENQEMMYIDTNGGNMYIGGSIGIGTEPNINYSISSSSNIFIGNTLYSSNILTTLVKHNENSITGIYLTEDGNLILNAEDSVVLNGYSLGNTITIANVNVTGSVTTQKLNTKMSEIINSTDNTNPLNIQKSLESGLYPANPEIGNPISILSGDISNTDGTKDKYTSNIFQLSATGHITLGGVYPPTSGNKEYLIRGNIDESRISHFDGFLHFTNSNINKQSFTVTKDSRVGIGNQNPTGIFEIKNNFNEAEDTFTPATSMIYLDNSTGLSLPLIESVEYLDDIQSNLIITSNMNYNVYNSNYNIITSNYDIVTCNLISTDLLYDFNTDIYDLIITDTYNITSNLLIGSSNEVEDIIVKNTLFELTSNGTIYFNNDLIDMYRYNIEASNVLSYNLTANNIKSLSSNNIFNFNNSSLSNIGEIYTSNLYFSGEEVFVHNLDVYGDIIAQNVSSSILSTSEEYGFNEIRLTGDKILTTASNVAINVLISHRENQEYINDTMFISPTINLSQDVKAMHIKGNHQSMANRVYNSNNSIYVENETVPAKITQEYIVNENTFYIGVKNNSYTSNEDASMFIASSNNEVSYDTINQNNSNIAITIYKNNDIKIGNKTFINKEGYLTLGETEQITSNVLYVKGTAQILTSDETNSFSVKENGIGIGINEPNATVHVNHKQSYDAQYSDMVLIHDHVGDIENHIDDTYFVINRDGNVGIGVSQPSAKLQIADNFLPLTTNSNNLGSEELKWKGIYTNGLEMSDIKLIGNEVIGGLEIQEPNKLQSVSYQYYNTSNNSYYNDYSRTNTMINETSIITKQKNAMFINKGDIHYNSTADRVIDNVKLVSPTVNEQWVSVTWAPELGLFVAVSISATNYTKEPLYNMTANTTVTAVGTYIASASSEIATDAQAWEAFNGNTVLYDGWLTPIRYNSSTGEYTGTESLGGYSGEWIKIQVPYSIRLIAIKQLSIRHLPLRGPKDFVILGSNDDTNWTLLATYTNQTYSSRTDVKTWYVNSSTEYTYYAMVVSANGGDGYLEIGEMELITSFNNVMTSPDGINWTTRSSAADNEWYGITWASELGLLVAVAGTGTGNRVMTSPDGINWTTRSTPVDNNWWSITWAPELGLFVAVATTVRKEPAFAMTANTTVTAGGTYIASASTQVNIFTLAYIAFDSVITIENGWLSLSRYNSSTGEYTGSASLGGYSGEWIKLQLPYSVPLSIFKYKPRYPTTLNRAPKEGVILGSNDNTNWSLLYSFSNQIFTSVDEFKYLNINSTTEYLYYAMVITKNNGDAYTSIGEIQLLPYGFNNVMTSPDGINWTTRSGANDNNWIGITWAPELGLFVACSYSIGNNDKIMTSPDGINWTTRNSGPDNDYVAIAWSPELKLLVATGGGTNTGVITSPDGINWTARKTENQLWWAVCWCPGINIFAAVSSDNAGQQLMTSPDGIVWTTQNTHSNLNYWRGIVWSPELYRFVAVSYGGSYQILVSGDPNPKPVNSFGLDLQTGAGGLNVMAPVVNQELAWTTRVSAADNGWIGVTWAPELGLFVAVATDTGTGNRVMTSPDGITWTSRISAVDNNWWGITWAPELRLLVAVARTGQSGNRVMTSPDGINWTTRSTPVDNEWIRITWSPELGLLVAVSYTVTKEPVFAMTANTTVTASGTYIASASTEYADDALAYRAFDNIIDGSTYWHSASIYSNGTYTGSASLGGYTGEWITLQLPYAIPLKTLKVYPRTNWESRMPKEGYILGSNDGTNWTLIYTYTNLTYPSGISGVGVGELYINSSVQYSYYGMVINKLFGTGVDDQSVQLTLQLLPYLDNVMTSPDGINWTTRSTPVDNDWIGLTWSSELGLLVAVASSGTGNRVMTSSDGINWTTRSNPVDNAWYGITWAPELGLFVAVASSGTGNRVMTSSDGINWTTRSSAADNNWYGITWAPELGLFITSSWSGTGNRIMTSPDGINWTTHSTNDNHWLSITWAPELGLLVTVSTTGTGNRVMTAEGTKIKKSILSIKNNKSQINGPLGIGTEPIINSGVTVIQPISQNNIIFGGASGNTLLHSPGIEISTDTHKWGIFTNYSPHTNLMFASSAINDNYVGVAGYIDNTNTDNKLNFTGQHRCYVENKSYTELQNMKGLIVSANKNEYRSMSGGLVSGNKAITIDESLPVVSLTSKEKDITVFGIISDVEDPKNRADNYGNFVTPYDKDTGDTRVYINSVGEGGIWVIDKNGVLESGDFITSSSITGYGIKQEDDILYSYTVAKITMNCDFNPLLQPVRRIKKDANGNNILNEYGNIVWENTEDLESEYNIRYLNIDGIEITEEDYLEKQNNNEEVYKAAFVGCTYHCG